MSSIRILLEDFLDTKYLLSILAFYITHITSASFVRLGVVCTLAPRETDCVRALKASPAFAVTGKKLN